MEIFFDTAVFPTNHQEISLLRGFDPCVLTQLFDGVLSLVEGAGVPCKRVSST